ncbi:hypothetical protein HaLaN_20278 [Haematococcus lacustris]|uniref:Uncharacterized protein n=1 Tax=Haematococcus lacustris TaxID=44745 RepID=A0A699ZVI5_HAELA|nr:hypothetical protein HaLaN_20278 [Haematococcus lacustris]
MFLWRQNNHAVMQAGTAVADSPGSPFPTQESAMLQPLVACAGATGWLPGWPSLRCVAARPPGFARSIGHPRLLGGGAIGRWAVRTRLGDGGSSCVGGGHVAEW